MRTGNTARTSPRPHGRRRTRPDTEREFLASLIQDTARPVLEIGAGACACLTHVLARHGLRVLAIDRDAEAVMTARRSISGRRWRRRVVLVQADAARLPFQSASLRTVVAFNALHHADALRGAVVEIARILHGAGRLIISDWDEAKDGYLDRLDHALRARFRRLTVVKRSARRVYLAREPRRSAQARSGHALVRCPLTAAAA